jgi:hypothetical protein
MLKVCTHRSKLVDTLREVATKLDDMKMNIESAAK